MIIGLAGFKGGISKTVSAVHIAGVLSRRDSVLLVDSDPNRSATAWSKRGPGLPFTILNETEARRVHRTFDHTVFDTEARPSAEDMNALAGLCDVLILPSLPDALSVDGLMQTLQALNGRKNARAMVAAAPPGHAAAELQDMLRRNGWPVFKTVIRRFAAYQKAAFAGRLVRDIADPKAQIAWSDYESLVRELRNAYGK